MHTRREFFLRAAGGAAGLGGLLGAIRRAAAIEPTAGSSVLDAEHVVILMQENRSFDHAYGTLRGVRGYDDPRAITLPDGSPVWAQANSAGERFLPFRLDIKDTKITWMGALPHGWTDQTDARNGGRYDRWLPAKRSGHRDYAKMPLTLGYYTRADIPFYYALADAFTICDQHFCSSLTGTTPNRCYLWSGTVRAKHSADEQAVVRNDECDHDTMRSWPTFPERLEDQGISWKVYQNEITIESGFNEDEDNWLSNFSDNPLEFFTQYNVRLAANHRRFVARRVKELPGEVEALRKQGVSDGDQKLAKLIAALKRYEAESRDWTQERFDALSPRERALHIKAFCDNAGDADYRKLVEIEYRDGPERRRMAVPKGDLLHQFRKDVTEGKLPTVSWIVAPEKLSDHPSSAWYGAWYLAEIFDILTRNPAVWKKTVFMLTYDENDGYFDHVPPFVAPHPRKPETGRVTKGIDTGVEYVELAQDRKFHPRGGVREGPIGLGYRVPLVIASPWSRGGVVCSQVFDHTSSLQFLEKLLSHKIGKKVQEPNITQWRRTVCGDLMSAFQPTPDAGGSPLPFPPRDEFLQQIHNARFKKEPNNFRALSKDEIEQLRRDPRSSPLMPRQEPGQRRSAPLPYQLAVDGTVEAGRFVLSFAAGRDVFGDRSAGAPFTVYAWTTAGLEVRNYAVEPGERLDDAWPLTAFANGQYRLRVYGPNGFFREFAGSEDPPAEIRFDYARAADGRSLTGGITIDATGRGGKDLLVEVGDNSYGTAQQSRKLSSDGRATIAVDTSASHGWYDVTVRVAGNSLFAKRYAGRVETGKWSVSDPLIGRPVA
jgi:phospholipase C